jgi:hypothetical protein
VIRPLGPGAGTAAVMTIGLDLEDNVTGGVVGRSSRIVPIYSRKFASTRNVGVLGTKNLWKNYLVSYEALRRGGEHDCMGCLRRQCHFAWWKHRLGIDSDGSSYF